MMDRRMVLGSLAGSTLLSAGAAAAAGIPIDRFGPANGSARATIVMLHGSDGLTNAGRYEQAAELLASAGYSVILPRYFEATGDRRANYREIGRKFPIWSAAIRGATDEVAGSRRGGIGVVGFSLGGALALAASTQDRRIAAVVNFFGFFPDELASATRAAPTLTLHGDADRVVPVENARRIAQRLQELGIPAETQIYPREGHGLSARSFIDASVRTSGFLSRYL